MKNTKSKKKVLLLENIHEKALNSFDDSFDIEILKEALSETDLKKKIKDVDLLGIRSKTTITRDIIKEADRLLAIGTFCVGTNQVDLNACRQNGVAVFNAPYSNTRSVVEMALGLILVLSRKIFDKSIKLRKGDWDKSASDCNEVRGKTLGIIGYGNIGSQLSVLAENIGMKVIFYDLEDKLALGNSSKCNSINELLSSSDYISIHVDGRSENDNLINKDSFKLMKDGVIFLNLSRGSIVNIDELKSALEEGKVKAAAIDVFPQEPKSNDDKFESTLLGMDNVILTPHIGGSTMEAQVSIAEYVSNKLLQYLRTGSTILSVNMPQLQLGEVGRYKRFIHIHKNVPGVLAEINSLVAKHGINIEGQYLKTDEHTGYVITDTKSLLDDNIISDLQNINATIKLRCIF